jgi:hypothetical protein
LFPILNNLLVGILGPEKLAFWDRKLISCACPRNIESGEIKI